jgi:DNA-binding CsgD family transcriptional regulator
MKKRPHAKAQRRGVAIRILFFPSFLRLCVSRTKGSTSLRDDAKPPYGGVKSIPFGKRPEGAYDSWRFILCSLLFVLCANAFGQTASRTDGVTVHYYASIYEAVAAAGMAVDDQEAAGATVAASIDQPDEITLLADIVLDTPLSVAGGVHIRLVAGGSDRTIRRSANLIEYPVIWVNGEGAILSLGKPGMEHELVIDGGYLNSPPIKARTPLVAVSGPDSKLIMYDNVTIQNNYNNGTPIGTSHYEHGSGVFIRTQEDKKDQQAEFIMKGGTIRGNINDIQTPLCCGGGVFIAGFAVFTMEGGVIMNNTARLTGGGFHTGGRGSFKKTGGIVYGSKAPAGYRNTAVNGTGTPKTYGHAVCVASANPSFRYRNDTVTENDNLSFTGSGTGENYIFGEGDKWDNPDKALRRILLAVILPVLAFGVCVFLILRKRALQKLMKIARTAPEIVFENANLSDREMEVGKLLLTELSMKQIASVMKLAYTTVDYHAKNLYRKLDVQNRTELIVKMRNEK